MTADEGQIGNGLHIVCARAVLGNSHGIENNGRWRYGISARRPHNVSRRNARDLGHLFRSIIFDRLDQSLKASRTLGDVIFIRQALFDYHMSHAV